MIEDPKKQRKMVERWTATCKDRYNKDSHDIGLNLENEIEDSITLMCDTCTAPNLYYRKDFRKVSVPLDEQPTEG